MTPVQRLKDGQTLGCRKGIWVEEMASAKALRQACTQQRPVGWSRLSQEMRQRGAVWISEAR